jgi:YHS domain-containing protein
MATSTSETLLNRIDAEFSAADKRRTQSTREHVAAFHDRQERMERFNALLDRLGGIWRPRLQTLAQKFDQRVEVKPDIKPGRRSATLEFQSELARVKLRFAVAPDEDVHNAVFTYDLEIIPILMKFESHNQLELSIDKVDESVLANWIDDRIISFVQTYLAMYENQYYLRDHMVEDPIAKVRFPKYAAASTLNTGGKTVYFIDESTRNEFEKQHAASK